MTNLPVTEMILYKHGVGFFQREGKVREDNVTLMFRHDEINDVLKSLIAFDRSDGKVLGIHYRTPKDQETQLQDSSIRLSDRKSLLDLLRDLRGRNVELDFAEISSRGRLIGVDVDPEEPLEKTLITLARDEDDKVQVFRLKSLYGIRLLDKKTRHDLHFFLDISQSEDLRRSVTIRLSPDGKHKLVVMYVAPSPTWRVSYRLVAETDEGKQQGTALLQGWGIFDNRLDEDLEDVQVTLVAGQPISFIYDLYSSRIPERPVVEDASRVAPGPVEFQAEREERAVDHQLKRMGAGRMMAAAPAQPAAAMQAAPEPLSRAALADAAPPAAEGRDAGEFFQYVVNAPVSVRRGESALVPIISTDVSYQRELLYNGAKLPGHPVVAMRFSNDTGLTLERGPVTVVEDGEYKGEAVVPFSKTDNEVYLAFAVELGIAVKEESSQRREIASLNIQDRYLVINEYMIQTTNYIIDNTTEREQTVTIEAPIRSDYELFDTPEPDTKTLDERRWQIVIEAHGTAEFTRRERRMTRRHEEVRNLSYRQLQRYMAHEWLDEETINQLEGLLENLAFIQEARDEQQTIKVEREEIYERQAQLRENLNTLKPAGEEGVLRARMLEQMSTSEDRLQEIDERIEMLDQQIVEAEQQIESILNHLGGERQP